MARPRNGPDPEEIARDINLSVNAFRQLDRRAQFGVIVLLLIVGIVAAAIYYQSHHSSSGGQSAAYTGSPQMLLGNPSNATPDASNRNNYLMVKPFFALSYNDANGTPNWVSWQVTLNDLGEARRKPTFDSDTTLPFGFNVVAHKDYSGSGFDRGHMCPHSDRAASEETSFATFVMTNIIPQAPNVNRKAWAQLENYGRDLVRHQQDRLYIIAGPVGRGGVGSNGPRDVLAGGKVVVPSDCWKIIVVVSDSSGDNDLARITTGTRVISVIMPNDDNAVGEEWARFRTSPAEIERRTGYHFFDRLPGDIAQSLRQKVDTAFVPTPRPMIHTGE